jgi:hypothetical protein
MLKEAQNLTYFVDVEPEKQLINATFSILI